MATALYQLPRRPQLPAPRLHRSPHRRPATHAAEHCHPARHERWCRGAFTSNAAIWSTCVIIINYDEHGGFFDHVEPPGITTPPAGPYDPFATLGVRVPGFVLSPFVEAGSVSHGLFDHTSVLQLLAERFGSGSYSPDVDRRHRGTPALDRLSNVLTRDTARPDVSPAPDVIAVHDMSENERAFHEAVTSIRERYPERLTTYLRTDIQAP